MAVRWVKLDSDRFLQYQHMIEENKITYHTDGDGGH